MKILMLPVIIWSPLQLYADMIDQMCPKCAVNGIKSPLTPAGWTDGSNSDHGHPRLLHCINKNVLLVSRVYTCCNQHCVLGHNPDLMRKFNVKNYKVLFPSICGIRQGSPLLSWTILKAHAIWGFLSSKLKHCYLVTVHTSFIP